jgi:predicted nucleic acid-binding protein
VIVLDTTVLVYATGAAHPLREPSRALIEAVGDGKLEASTTPEVIQEFVHVRARRRGRSDAAALGREFSELLAPLLPVGAEQLQRGLSIFERTEHLGAFDAILAASALDAGAKTLVSADRQFSSVAEMGYLFPDSAAISHLIGE